MKKESVPVRNSLLLLLTATIWGVAFVAQSVSMDYVGGFTFNAVRNIIGAIALLPVIWGLGKTRPASEQRPSDRKTLITGGICCGILLCLASNFQQFGIKYTTVGKAGFITACYIIIVPVIGIFLKKKMQPVYLDRRNPFLMRSVPSLPDTGRGICHWQGRAARADLCSTFFPAYPGDRPFLTSGRRRKNVLHPVPGLRYPLRAPCLAL